jgi:PAS domain S-box-containing protein
VADGAEPTVAAVTASRKAPRVSWLAVSIAVTSPSSADAPPDAASTARDDGADPSLFALLVEQVVDYAIFVLDPHGMVATWNPGAERVKGYRRDEIIGQPYQIFFPDEDRQAGKPQRVLQTARTTGRYQEEGWRVRKDGTRFWASVVVTALHDRAGELRGFAKITRDLTERRAAEDEARRAAEDRAARRQAELDSQELRRSRDELDLILRSIGEGVKVQGVGDERLLFANDVAASLCGFDSVEQMMSTPRSEIVQRFEVLREDGTPFPPHEFPGRLALQGKASTAIMRFRQRQGGEDRWSFVSAAPVLDPATGTTEFAVSVFREFTARKRAEQAWELLAEVGSTLGSSLDYESTLRAVANLAVPALADWCTVEMLGTDGTLRDVAIAHADPAAVQLVREWRLRWPPSPDSAMHRVARTGTPERIQLTPEILAAAAPDPEHARMLTTLGLRSAMVVPLSIGSQTIGVLTFVTSGSGRDYGPDDLRLAVEIARRASLAVDNARAYLEARTAVRVRDNFLSIASHELRTPLSGLSILLTSLIRAVERGRLEQLGEQGLRDRLVKAQQQSAQLGRLVDRLLDVSRLSSAELDLDLAETDLGDVVREVVDRLHHIAQENGARIEVRASDKVVGTWDRVRIDQVITNLLTNALKHAPGALVTVSVGTSGRQRARLVVSDDGPGIPPDHQQRIFDQFERGTSPSVPGMGLGLWIVRRTVAAHGGSVTLESSPGKGATFTVVLPVAPEPPRDGGAIDTREGV